MSIRIINPVPGQATHLSHSKALRLVKSGRGEFVDSGSVKLTKLNDSQIDAINQFVYKVKGYDYATEHKVSNRKEIAALPCVAPHKLITVPTTKSKPVEGAETLGNTELIDWRVKWNAGGYLEAIDDAK